MKTSKSDIKNVKGKTYVLGYYVPDMYVLIVVLAGIFIYGTNLWTHHQSWKIYKHPDYLFSLEVPVN